MPGCQAVWYGVTVNFGGEREPHADTPKGCPMNYSPSVLINSVLGGMAVTVGLWLLLGDLSVATTVIIVVGGTIVLVRMSPTVAHVWAWSLFLLGLESLAWPFQMLGELSSLGPEPPLEDMQRIFTAVLFGLFSGVFWLTFAYGIYRRIQGKLVTNRDTVDGSVSKAKAKAMRKKNR